LISDRSAELSATVDELKEKYSSLPLRACEVEPGPIPSRTANVLAGLRQATGDYVWFVDDDDMVMPDALAEIQACVTSRHHPVLVAGSAVYDEVWRFGRGGRDVLEWAKERPGFEAPDWARVFSGVNPLPICSMVYPRGLISRVVTDERFRNDLSEDYGMLLAAVGDAQADVRIVPATIAGVSRRRGEESDSAMAMEDREPWVAGISGFVADILSVDSGYSATLVDLGARVSALMRTNDRLRLELRREEERTERVRETLESMRAKDAAGRGLVDSVARLKEARGLPQRGAVSAGAAGRPRQRSRLRRFLGRVKRRILGRSRS
jgi:hypothetical protein